MVMLDSREHYVINRKLKKLLTETLVS